MLQFCHDRLVLERLVIVAELERRVQGTCRLVFKGDRQVGDHHRLGSCVTQHNVWSKSCTGVFRDRVVQAQLCRRLGANERVLNLGPNLLDHVIMTLVNRVHVRRTVT